MRWKVAIIVALLPAMGLSGADAQELLENGDFGTSDEGWVTGWQVAPSHRGVYEFADDDGLSGVGALRYAAQEKAPAGPVTQTFASRPLTEYVLMAAVKTDGTVNPLVRVVDPRDGRVIAGVLARGQMTWTKLSAQFNSGDATELEAQIFGSSEIPVTGEAQIGTSTVDDVQVYAVADVPKEIRPRTLFTPPGPNLALGKPYTYRPRAKYPYCRDPDDAVQLTDGAYTIGYFWTQKSTVGWMRTQQANITVDLQEDQPISGVSFNTAAGVARVEWPSAIYLLVSDDDTTWHLVGDLRALSTDEIGEPPEGYATHRFATSKLRTHGRYVRLMAIYFPFCFCDEIEVYRGPDELLAVNPPGERIDDPAAFAREAAVLAAVRWRLVTDLGDACKAIADAGLPDAERQALEAEADEIEAAIDALPAQVPEGFTTVLPLNEVHQRIYALNAWVLRARGFEGLTAWAQNRWDPLSPIQAPDEPPGARKRSLPTASASPAEAPPLRVDMMLNEHRAAAFNLTNATDAPVSARVSVHGLPGGDNPAYVSVREVLFTDTREQRPIAAALPEAEGADGGFAVHIPAGMTRQVWLSLHPQDVAPGTYEGHVNVAPDGGLEAMSLLMTLRVYPVTFPDEPTLALGGWDYTDTDGLYGVTSRNMGPLIEALREHYVNTPWATRGAMPKGGDYDDQGRLTNELDFSRWDRWLTRWPDARYYNVFLRAPDNFEGEPIGTPRFDRMVGDWVTAWVNHMAEQGIEPGRLQLLVVDEPTRPEQSAVIVAYAKAIKAAQPDVVIWEDTRYKEPWNADEEVFRLADVLCPNAYVFLRADQRERDFYLGRQADGTRLWFYDCSGPGKALDPYAYHRGQMWMAIQYGALGSGFWAFGSCGGTGATSWNAYAQRETEYTPLFIGEDSVTDGKHMEAIREGVQDYEYFVMLRKRVEELKAKGVGGDAVERAAGLLESGPGQVTEAIAQGGVGWTDSTDRSLMDRVRVDALEALVGLSAL